ncbi:MAG TPA: DUF1573 domain-containing protein [Saprospiraceae bacterium]|nr:DUF1573 domain-containing protein [Saprospiraceae bacterium]
MKISLCFAYALLCALCASFLHAQPKLTVVGGAGVDFGSIYYAKKVSHNFQILNSGTQTLTITEIKTFCSCTKVKISSKRIAPNTNAVLTLTFDPKIFVGDISKAIHLISNDQSSPTTPIMFTANIFKLLEMSPDYVFFGVFPSDSTASRTLKIKNVSPNTLKILRLTSKDSFIKATARETTLAPGMETELTVTASPHRPVTMKGQLLIETNSSIDKKIKVEYTGLAVQK